MHGNISNYVQISSGKTYGVLEVLLNTKKFEYAINAKEKTLSLKHAMCCLETISQGVN